MTSVNWFSDLQDSKKALKEMVQKNCAFMLYIGKGNDELSEIFRDTDIIKLLNNELFICFKMDPGSPSFNNFEEIFGEVVFPAIYLLEKNNIRERIIKIDVTLESHKIQLDLKRQMLNAFYSTIKDISDTNNIIANKPKYLQYLTQVTNQLQILDKPISNHVQKVTEEVEKSNDVAKIKIKIPCKEVTLVQEFQTTSSLNEIKSFVLNNVNLPRGPIKFIAHRQFVDEDFSQTLDSLNLCPSSTIYVHMVPSSNQWKNFFFNPQSWLRNIYNFVILNPFYYIQNYFMNFNRRTPIEASRTVNNRPNITKTNKKSTYKRTSNIHRLKTSSDEDEKKTYNGNSTQQL